MWKEHKIKIISAIIGATATIMAASIALIPHFTQKEKEYPLAIFDTPAVKQAKSLPVIGTAIMYQGLYETFEKIGPGWQLDRNKYLKGGEVHILNDEPNSNVHTLFNTQYALGTGSYEIKVDARQISGQAWSCGLSLKVLERDEILFFSIRKDGRFRVTKYKDGHWHDYSNWKQLPMPLQTGKVNLKISNFDVDNDEWYDDPEAGKVLYFFVNYVLVEKINNDWINDFLLVGLFSTMNIHAAFDNLKVKDYSFIQDKLMPSPAHGSFLGEPESN